MMYVQYRIDFHSLYDVYGMNNSKYKIIWCLFELPYTVIPYMPYVPYRQFKKL